MSWSLLLGIAVTAAVVGGVAWLVWWLFFETEGVYLGPRVVVWLYDVYATRYDNIKQFVAAYEADGLAAPLLERLRGTPRPRILDVATGTARLQVALHHTPHFQGSVIGVDASRRMLGVARAKLQAAGVSLPALAQNRADALPFADNQFDAVTCLEALEFFPDADQAIAECLRVLKAGGVLFLTNRKGTRLMPGRTRSVARMKRRLTDKFGLVDVESAIWQVDYDQVWGYKPAAANSAARSVSSIGEPPQ
jgi:ubiquinone/menaquinone biosynthesis C-methylase UbiE